jgi:NTP pyrophosphatase (non-canonical NTP hydrolase)
MTKSAPKKVLIFIGPISTSTRIPMTFDEFKTDALRTESKPEALNFSSPGLLILLTAAVQMAKMIDTAKKTMFYGKPFDENKFRDELAVFRSTMDTVQARAHNLANVDDVSVGLTVPNLRILHGSIGMFGEAGELLEALLKSMRSGELDEVNIGEELGDAFWYAAIIADETGVSFDQAQETVVKKLKARYGEKFTSEAALNRDLVAERAILEAGLSDSAATVA